MDVRDKTDFKLKNDGILLDTRVRTWVVGKIQARF